VIHSRKKLSLWSALPPYLGGKRRLCPLIFREIDRIVPRREWRRLTFLDAFLGGGSVSLYAKAQGFHVVATDIAERAITIGQALIANSRVRLAREDVLRLLLPYERPSGRVESMMAPSVFTKDQARFIDTALWVAAETADPVKAALIRLLTMRTALLCHAYAQVRKGTIHRVTTGEYESITESAVYHYVDGLRLTTPSKLWDLAQQINAGVFEGRARILKRSVLEALPEIQADVAYFDPPYPGVMSYEREYKVIDEILEGSSRPTSPFTAKTGASMLDGLFERATHIPVWVLSLGNAVVGIEELEGKMARFGRTTRAIALRYQHLPAVATEEKKRENKEFVIVGVDPDAALLRKATVRVVPDEGLEHLDAVVGVELKPHDPSPEGLASKPRADDLPGEGGAPLGHQSGPFLPGDAPGDLDPRLDHPDAVGIEGRSGGDADAGRTVLDRHDA